MGDQLTHEQLAQALDDLLPGRWHFRPSTGSTNDDALQAAAAGAPDGSLFLADAQTQGRGRAARRWHTPPASALALSFLLRPRPAESPWLSRFSGLAAVALREALAAHHYPTAIKWPNDLLLQGKKVAGILIEVSWSGAEAEAVILGIGLNVRRSALPPEAALSFPATSLESVAPPPPRARLVRDIVTALIRWRPRLGSPSLLADWEAALAWRGECVQAGAHRGQLLGLTAAGHLRLQTAVGEIHLPQAADHLRPCNL